MSNEIDFANLANMIKAKRGKSGLRVAAQEIGGITASTLSRIENGKVPDLDTFVRICRWLDVPTDHFTNPASSNFNEPEIVSLHLRADRTLDQKTARALVKMMQLAVAAVDEGKLGKTKGKHAPRL